MHFKESITLSDMLGLFLPPLMNYYWDYFPEMMRAHHNMGITAAIAGIRAAMDPDVDPGELMEIAAKLMAANDAELARLRNMNKA
ncbi:hypothetical protein NB710_001181 [Xanthomonas sacchari]|nr:hypothetical protein [Xanthomonas sacchari]